MRRVGRWGVRDDRNRRRGWCGAKVNQGISGEGMWSLCVCVCVCVFECCANTTARQAASPPTTSSAGAAAAGAAAPLSTPGWPPAAARRREVASAAAPEGTPPWPHAAGPLRLPQLQAPPAGWPARTATPAPAPAPNAAAQSGLPLPLLLLQAGRCLGTATASAARTPKRRWQLRWVWDSRLQQGGRAVMGSRVGHAACAGQAQRTAACDMHGRRRTLPHPAQPSRPNVPGE